MAARLKVQRYKLKQGKINHRDTEGTEKPDYRRF